MYAIQNINEIVLVRRPPCRKKRQIDRQINPICRFILGLSVSLSLRTSVYSKVHTSTKPRCVQHYLADKITSRITVAVNYIEFDYSAAPYCRREILEKQNIMRSTLLDAVRYEIQFFCIHCWQLPFQLSTFTFVSLCPFPCTFLLDFRLRFGFRFAPDSHIADNKLNAASFVHKE